MVRFFRVIDDALNGKRPPGRPLRQWQLAEVLGCSQQAIATYRSGESVPADTKAKPYATALGYSVEEMRAILDADRATPQIDLMREATGYFSLFEKTDTALLPIIAGQPPATGTSA